MQEMKGYTPEEIGSFVRAYNEACFQVILYGEESDSLMKKRASPELLRQIEIFREAVPFNVRTNLPGLEKTTNFDEELSKLEEACRKSISQL